jgi:hypothetical protein
MLSTDLEKGRENDEKMARIPTNFDDVNSLWQYRRR